jgi:hypothetical protein
MAEHTNIQVRMLPSGSRQRQHKQRRNSTRRFIAWDGEETKDAGYCLFGASVGIYLQKPHLSSVEMLELLLDVSDKYPDAFHVGYAFDYDVNQIIKDMDKLHVAVLHQLGHVTWQGYRIAHIPHKILKVSDKNKQRTIRLDDGFHYFRTRFDKALIKYKIGTPDEQRIVSNGKDAREDFWYRDIDKIREYWKMELRLMVGLMDRIRTNINTAGFYIGEWHGPGALAKYALRQRGISKHKNPTPPEIIEPALFAYSGGWFERFRAGIHDGPVYTADLNSAYIHAARQLPSLATGEWEYIVNPDPMLSRRVRMGLFRIRRTGTFAEYMATCRGIPLPLFQRQSNKTLSHPVAVENWYWNPEASRVASHSNVEFFEAYIFHDDGTYPFSWVGDMYDQRLLMQRVGNPGEQAFKWALASMYGAFAQRVGWNQQTRTPPRWHQIEWAGWITSLCRSLIFDAALPVALQGGLVSIDTDGIMSTVPFDTSFMPSGEGEQLGQWKIERFEGLVYVQNGLYWLLGNDGEWIEPKLRGIPKGRSLSVGTAIRSLEYGHPMEIRRKQFVGYGAALHRDWSTWRTWIGGDDEPPNYSINVNRSGNRIHVPMFCKPCQYGYTMTDCLHELALSPSNQLDSAIHRLPWREPVDEKTARMMAHLMGDDDM